ncbi:hypothetical protein [Rossellomorea vietnamensis]|uniref:hypothetical protein n=1 Tax=Rossellomorea vietnamensis TaxID=218284 RepID=UPI003CECE9EA
MELFLTLSLETGPDPRYVNALVYWGSGPDFVSALGDVLDRDVHVEQVTDEKYGEVMKGLGLPDFVVSIVVGIQESIRNGSLAVESKDFEKVLGRPVTPLNEGLKQIVDAANQAK